MTTSTIKQDLKASIKGLISLPLAIISTSVNVVANDVLPLAQSAVSSVVPVTKEVLAITTVAAVSTGVVLSADKTMTNAAVDKRAEEIMSKSITEQLLTIKKATPSFINDTMGGEW